MFKFIYEGDRTKVEHEIKTCPNLPDMLDLFRDFLRGAGFEFSEQIVFEDEPEEGVCTIDEIADENEALRQEIKELRKKAEWDEAFTRKLEKEKQAQYDHWIAEVKKLQDELKKQKNSTVPLGGIPITRATVITREGREYETWLDDSSEFMLEFQDDGRTLKLFEIDREDREFLV